MRVYKQLNMSVPSYIIYLIPINAQGFSKINLYDANNLSVSKFQRMQSILPAIHTTWQEKTVLLISQ